MSSVSGPGRPGVTTRFDQTSEQLLRNAEGLQRDAGAALTRAGDHIDRAGDSAQAAAAHTLGAAVNSGMALARGAEAGFQAARAGAHAAAGVGVGATGVVVEGGEEALGLGARALNAASRGFAWMSTKLHELVGDGTTVTVREVEGDGRGRLSAQLYEASRQQFARSREAGNAFLNSFEQSVGHAIGTGVNLVYVAGYTGQAAASVGAALARTGQSAALELGSRATVLGAAGVQAAENGVQGAAELMRLAAEVTADGGRALASPSGGDSVQIQTEHDAQYYDQRLEELLRQYPDLRTLPALRGN